MKVKFYIVEFGRVDRIHTVVTLDFRLIVRFVDIVKSHF